MNMFQGRIPCRGSFRGRIWPAPAYIIGVWGFAPSGVQELAPGQGVRDKASPEAERFLAFARPKERQICPILANLGKRQTSHYRLLSFHNVGLGVRLVRGFIRTQRLFPQDQPQRLRTRCELQRLRRWGYANGQDMQACGAPVWGPRTRCPHCKILEHMTRRKTFYKCSQGVIVEHEHSVLEWKCSVSVLSTNSMHFAATTEQ